MSETAGKKKEVHVAEVVRHGDKIILPPSIPLSAIIEILKKQMEYEESKVAVNEVIDCFPWDGARALKRAMKEKFGVAEAEGKMTWLGYQPPQEIAVEVDYGKTELVPWGRFMIAVTDGLSQDYIETAYEINSNGVIVFKITGVVRRKYQNLVKEVAVMVRQLVAEDSLYLGKAIRVKFLDENGERIPLPTPKFWKKTEAEPIFSDELTGLIDTNIYTPLRSREACKRAGIPFKRGSLLAGVYGTGKTMVAGKVANLSTENGITFIYLEDVRELADGIRFAQQYSPAVIFAEDVDRATQGSDRTTTLDRILNTLDGIDSKAQDIMVVLTTNHLETINQAMLRPGRLDVILDVKPPDAKAAAKLVKFYSGSLLDPNTDLVEVGEMLKDQIPAVIRETVERSKLGIVARTGRVPAKGTLVANDLIVAAATLDQQKALLEPKTQDTRTPDEKAARVLGEHIENASTKVLAGIAVLAKGGSTKEAVEAAATAIHGQDGRKRLAGVSE